MSQLDASAKGVYLITVTQFTDSGALNLRQYRQHGGLLFEKKASLG